MNLLLLIVILLLGFPIASNAGTIEDYLCRVYMEQAMKAHEALPKERTSYGTITDGTASVFTNPAFKGSPETNLYVCDNGKVCIETPEYTYTPDTRTEDQKLDDEIAEIERRRTRLRELEKLEQEHQRQKEIDAAIRAEATRLWEKAKTCWSKP